MFSCEYYNIFKNNFFYRPPSLLTIQPKQYSILTPVLDRIGSLF